MDKKLKKAIQDMISGLVMLCLGLIMIFVIIPKQIKTRSMLSATASSGVNARGFPLFSCWIIVISAVLLVISALVRLLKLRSEARRTEEGELSKKSANGKGIRWVDEGRAVLLMLLCALYMLLFVKIGYIWATIIVPPLMLLLLGGRSWKHFVSVYGFGVVIFILFKFVMKVPLP